MVHLTSIYNPGPWIYKVLNNFDVYSKENKKNDLNIKPIGFLEDKLWYSIYNKQRIPNNVQTDFIPDQGVKKDVWKTDYMSQGTNLICLTRI